MEHVAINCTSYQKYAKNIQHLVILIIFRLPFWWKLQAFRHNISVLLIPEKISNKGIHLFPDSENGFHSFKRERNSPSIVFGRRAHLLHFSVKWAYFHAFIRFITFLYKNINKNSNVNTWKFSISEIIEGSKMHFKSLTIPSLISMTSWWPWSGWLNLPKERKLKSEFLIPKPSFRVWPQRKKSVS